VHQCLQDRMDHEQVLKSLEAPQMYIKYSSCHNDGKVQSYGSKAAQAELGAGAGEGRVHQCLRERMDQLTEPCRQEELKLNIIQSRDIRLRPRLAKLCSEEIAVFCKDVPPGGLLLDRSPSEIS